MAINALCYIQKIAYLHLGCIAICPECGKENVSDSAESCPDCGYQIKSHFEKIKKEEEEKTKRKEKIDSIEKPTKPTVGGGFITFIVVATILVSWYVFDPCFEYGFDAQFILFWFLFMFMFVGVPSLIYKWDWNNRVEKYELACRNFEEYKKQRIEYEDKFEQMKQERLSKNAKCPNCESKNTKSLSTTGKIVSVSMVGLASNKIGKAYECKDCGYRW